MNNEIIFTMTLYHTGRDVSFHIASDLQVTYTVHLHTASASYLHKSQ